MVIRVLRNSILILAATAIANFLASLFHFFVARALGPAGYGIFGSLLALLSILNMPLTVASLAITRFISEFKAAGEPARMASLIASSARKSSGYGILVVFALILGSQLIAEFLKLP